MCVTNIAKRQRQPVAVSNGQAVGSTPSQISQRLMGNFMPLMLNNTIPKPVGPSTVSTQGNVLSFSGPSALHGFPLQPSTAAAPAEKKRPRRRRKPQKPGKTAKQNDRHFVVHNYHDHAGDVDVEEEADNTGSRRRGGVAISFPLKLHAVLDQVEADGLAHVVSWSPHGRCFVIHKPKEFVDHIMPHYFRQSKLTSFQRQLNLYGFQRLTRGNDSGGYYHELFLRGKPFLTKKMTRTKVKGTKFKAASSPDQEPDFYSMPPVIVSPPTTSDECSADERTSSSPSIVRKKISESMFNNFGSTTSMFEPVPILVPDVAPAPAMEPYPMVAQPTFTSNNVTNWEAFNSVATMQPTAAAVPSTADHILDEAVDELFSAGPLPVDAQELNQFWDTSDFGEEGVQDDTQLGYLLEKFLDD